MSKKSKNIILVLAGVFFLSIALLYTENSSKISNFPKDLQKEVEEVIGDEYVFVKADDVSDEEIISDELDENIEKETASISNNTYRVVNVVDGDTIDVVINGKEERLRLIGIDTPETKDPRVGVECFGKEASEKTKQLLLGKYISLEADETQSDRDRYGRLLRYVFLEDGTNFNELMIQEGYANEYTYDSAYKYQQEFKNAEINARQEKKGLWGDSCKGN